MRKFPTKLLLAIKQAYVVNYYFYAILINTWDGDFLWRYIKSVSFFITNWKRNTFYHWYIHILRFSYFCMFIDLFFNILHATCFLGSCHLIRLAIFFEQEKKIFEDTKWFVANKRRLCIKDCWSHLVSQSMTLEKTVLNTVNLFYFYFCGLSRWLKVHPAGPIITHR